MAAQITVNGDRFVEMISERRIKTAVKRLAKEIDRNYRGTIPVFIGILNGSFIFLADLVREVKVDCEIDFLKLSSYGDAKISSGNVRLLKDLNCQVEGRDIIIVEDIVDTGLTLDNFLQDLEKFEPASVKLACFTFKKEAFKKSFRIDYLGITIPNDFVVGYGLDYDGYGRNLPDIYKIVSS